MGIFGLSNIEELKASKNVKGLIEALKDEDSFVRRYAVAALRKIKDSKISLMLI